jgi:hypothetical protein
MEDMGRFSRQVREDLCSESVQSENFELVALGVSSLSSFATQPINDLVDVMAPWRETLVRKGLQARMAGDPSGCNPAPVRPNIGPGDLIIRGDGTAEEGQQGFTVNSDVNRALSSSQKVA